MNTEHCHQSRTVAPPDPAEDTDLTFANHSSEKTEGPLRDPRDDSQECLSVRPSRTEHNAGYALSILAFRSGVCATILGRDPL